MSTYYKDGLADILDRWPLTDLADAHLMLDCLEAAEAQARSKE